MPRVELRFRLDFANGFSVGPGKIELLRAIVRLGSLTRAALSLGVSYRRAWLLVKDLNDAFAQPVTTATVGGPAGGGVRVTDFGKLLLAAYDEVDRHHREHESALLRTLSGELSRSKPGSAVKPRIKASARRGRRPSPVA